MTESGSDLPRSRREARDLRLRADGSGSSDPVAPPVSGADRADPLDREPVARHLRRSPLARLRLLLVLVPGVALVLAAGAVVGGAFALGNPQSEPAAATASPSIELLEVDALPVPQLRAPQPAADICAIPEVTAALDSGDDGAVVRAAGGGEAFREAVVSGAASCVSLSDPSRLWLIVNKTRSFDPVDYAPADLALPGGVRNIVGAALRQEAGTALGALVAGAQAAGVGEIALDSGYRSYRTQKSSYGAQVSSRGVDGADLVSARPGFSEHQSGTAGDLVACSGSCGTMDQIAATPQGAWLAEHSWEYGWVVRYEDGYTDVTGYVAEPWHVRYIGPDLAAAYHEGGWKTLEQFFGLPAAPDYAE